MGFQRAREPGSVGQGTFQGGGQAGEPTNNPSTEPPQILIFELNSSLNQCPMGEGRSLGPRQRTCLTREGPALALAGPSPLVTTQFKILPQTERRPENGLPPPAEWNVPLFCLTLEYCEWYFN